MIADGCSNLGHVVDDDDVYLIIRSIGKPIIILDNRKISQREQNFSLFYRYDIKNAENNSVQISIDTETVILMT